MKLTRKQLRKIISERLVADLDKSVYPTATPTARSIFATWQQSQDDLSQPLVGNHLPEPEVNRMLAA